MTLCLIQQQLMSRKSEMKLDEHPQRSRTKTNSDSKINNQRGLRESESQRRVGRMMCKLNTQRGESESRRRA